MKKLRNILSTVLCAAVIASVVIPAGAVKVTDKTNRFSEGTVMKSGKYLVSLVNNFRAGQTRIYRTKLNGKGRKLVAKTKIFNDAQLYSYNGRIYYRKDESIIAYNPKTGSKSTALKLDPQNKYKISDKKGYLIKVAGICEKGFMVDYRDEGLCLVEFDGNTTPVELKDKNKAVYLCSTEKYTFYYKTELSKGSRYIARLYRYEYGMDAPVRVGDFATIKKAKAKPDFSTVYVTKKKIMFTAGSNIRDVFVGCLYSMNRDGTGLKTVKEKTNGTITPGKKCAFLSITTKKGDYSLCKLSENGKLSSAIKYNKGNYPLISYTTDKNTALAVTMSKFNYGYNLFALKKVAKMKGKKLFDADSQVKNAYIGNIVVSPSITGSAGHIALVTYGVYCYDDNGTLLDVYKCETFLINPKSGNKIKIDK